MESSFEALETCAKNEVLFGIVKDILDELTVQKIEMLENRINRLSIDTEEQLKGVVDLVFEKVFEKPNFCDAFANLCKRLVRKKVPSGSEDNNFRKLLLNKCQKEFERDAAEDFARIKRITDLNPDELHKELADLKRTLVQRSLANIKFICELFKLHMFTDSIMHDCIKNLLIKQDDDSLKCLCTLLIVVGKNLDSDYHCKMNKYFERMQEIVNKRQISTRIRFMLQDVIDLRQNNWTYSDVYESNDGCFRIISRTTNTIKKSTTTELQCTNYNPDSVPFYGKSHGTSSKTVHWTKQNPDDDSKQQIKTVLNQDEESSDDDDESSDDDVESSDDDDESHQKIDKMVNIETQKTEVVSGDCRVETLELALKENPYLNDETEIEKRAELLFQEYFENTDLQNTITSLSENFASTTISSFVSFAFDNVLKTTTHRRKNIGQLMSDLIKAELMPVEDFVKGLESFLIIAEQYINDIPNVWEYVGELIAPSIDDEVLSLPMLQEAVQSCFESGSVNTVISAVLNATPMNLPDEAIQQRPDIKNKISDGTPKTQIETVGGDTTHSHKETDEQGFVTMQKITTDQHMDQIPHSTCIRKCSRVESETVTEDAICASQSIPDFLTYSLKCVLGQLTGTTPLYDVVRLVTHFHAILCLSKEHKIDVSLSWDDLTELIEPFIKNESLPHSFLLQTSELCFKPGCIDCLCSFLSIFSRGISEQLELNEKDEVRRSDTKGSQFLPPDLNTTASKFAKKQVNKETVIFKVGPGSENIGSSNLNDDCGSRIKRMNPFASQFTNYQEKYSSRGLASQFTNYQEKDSSRGFASQFTSYQEKDSSRGFNRDIPFSSRNLYQSQDTRNVRVPRRDRNAAIQLNRARFQAIQRNVSAKEQCSNSEQ